VDGVTLCRVGVRLRAVTVYSGFTAVSYGSRYRTVDSEGLNAPFKLQRSFNGRTQYGRGPSRTKRPFRAV